MLTIVAVGLTLGLRPPFLRRLLVEDDLDNVVARMAVWQYATAWIEDGGECICASRLLAIANFVWC